MVISNEAIKRFLSLGHLNIVPLNADSIRPASVCLHLSEQILTFNTAHEPVDPTDETTYPPTESFLMTLDTGYDLAPNEFILAATSESIGLSKSLTGHLSNISGLARLGVTVALSTHVAPGFGELCARPLTLEIHNASRFFIRIKPGIRICHLILSEMVPPASIGYDEMFPKKYSGFMPIESQFSK